MDFFTWLITKRYKGESKADGILINTSDTVTLKEIKEYWLQFQEEDNLIKQRVNALLSK